MKNIPLRHVLIVAAFWCFFTFVFSKLIFESHGDTSLAELVSRGFSYNIFLAALTGVLYSYIRPVNFRVGLQNIQTKKNWILFYPVFIIILSLVVTGLRGGFSNLNSYGWFFINCIFVGISEELMFRGILLSGLVNKLGFFKAALIVIISFGLIHVFNVFVTGNLLQGIMQAFMAMSSGVLFLAIRVKTQSIIPAIIIHCFWDFTSFTNATPKNSLEAMGALEYAGVLVSTLLIISPLIFGVLGIIQLRKKQVVADFMESQKVAID